MHEGDDKPAASGSGKEEGAQLSAGSSEAAPADPAVAAPISSAPAGVGADAEIARLQAHVEDLRRENGMLWDQVKHEREARIREIELLNGMIQAMRRQVSDGCLVTGGASWHILQCWTGGSVKCSPGATITPNPPRNAGGSARVPCPSGGPMALGEATADRGSLFEGG